MAFSNQADEITLMQYRVRTLLIVLAFLLSLQASAQDKAEPGEALYGEWEIVEITFKGRVQVLPEPPVGWFIFDKGGFTWLLYGDAKKIRDQIHASKSIKKAWTEPCVIKEREIEVMQKHQAGLKTGFTALYEIKDGMLRFVWREDNGERPIDFDALKDPNLALYVAKKVK
jgi:hypothetical protein